MTPNTATNADDDIGIKWEQDDDISIEASEFKVLDPGSYVVEFVQFSKAQTLFGESLKLFYQVAEGSETGAALDEICSLKGGTGSKLKGRMAALRGRPYQPGESIRPRECFGLKARALVDVKDVTRNGETFQVNRVAGFSPLNATTRQGGQPAGQPAPGLRLAEGLEAGPRGEVPLQGPQTPIVGSNGDVAPF